jgi:tetratricopeptide (TPR) repeat protein
MAGRVPLAALALIAILGTAAGAAGPTVLVRYGFDDEAVETGPDTFAVFRAAHGRVGLSTVFRRSGYRSVEIRDVPGNGDFSELQGYFPEQRTGHVFAHFALLTARPEEELNIALAGPQRFRLGKDGIAFWLATREGRFVHVSDSIPRKLAPVRGFVWYEVDVAYDVEAGVYDLTIHEEGHPDPIVALRRQPGAARQRGSAVDVFSFISDPMEDASDVTYFVDDVSIATSRDVTVAPLVAPGRRKLFVDAFAEYRRTQDDKVRCLPAVSLRDFGIAWSSGALGARGITLLEEALRSGGQSDRDGALPSEDARGRVVGAAAQWREGCATLERGDAATALERFERAAASAPEGRIYGLSAVLALLAAGRAAEAEERLGGIASEWADDPRFAIVTARLAVARGDVAGALETLRPAAEAGDAAASERYNSALLWDRRWREARDFAVAAARRPTAAHTAADWLERAGDAAFQLGDAREARELYEEGTRSAPDQASLFLKLSDAAFVLEDVEAERGYRERYYGTLREP